MGHPLMFPEYEILSEAHFTLRQESELHRFAQQGVHRDTDRWNNSDSSLNYVSVSRLSQNTEINAPHAVTVFAYMTFPQAITLEYHLSIITHLLNVNRTSRNTLTHCWPNVEILIPQSPLIKQPQRTSHTFPIPKEIYSEKRMLLGCLAVLLHINSNGNPDRTTPSPTTKPYNTIKTLSSSMS